MTCAARIERAGTPHLTMYLFHHATGSASRAPFFCDLMHSSQRFATLAMTSDSISTLRASALRESGSDKAQTRVCVSVSTLTGPRSTIRLLHPSLAATSHRPISPADLHSRFPVATRHPAPERARPQAFHDGRW